MVRMGSDIRFRNMEVRCVGLLLKMLVFQMVIAWCGAKYISAEFPSSVDEEVQGSIRNLIHTGLYSHQHLDASQVEVVTPLKVNREGALISHQVDHSHEHGHARSRRDLHGKEHELDHNLHYNLTVDGKHLRLDLRPSVTFITPAMVVERHMAGGRTRQRPLDAATACHYTGSVRGQPYSSVALSACDGLAGLLRTEHGEYWIEPSKQAPRDGAEGRAHVVFRRSAVDKVEAWHRAKRAVDTRTNINTSHRRMNSEMSERYSRRMNAKRNRDNKELIDKKRREYLEARRKELEELRKNPTEWRRHQLKQRIEQRRMQSNSISSSISRESLEMRNRTRTRQNEQKSRRVKPRRRRRRATHCATKQPRYLWKEKNRKEGKNQKNKNNKNRRRYPRHHQLFQSQREEFEANRVARSVSRPRHVEVLLVADRSMTDFHNEGTLETYLLTIMNMVSSLYMDPSIGNYIKVVVVKIILVEGAQGAPDLEVSTNADATLSSFCRWQQELNPGDDENPHHHDVAILVTRKDICSQHDTPCSTLGVAHVAGMCKPDRSCSVNEDNGIMLAHTITHELGHNFGLYHDTEKIGCHRREGSTLHIMTPIFESDTVQVAWSRCSKRDVTNFLDAGLGECLGDRPHQEEYVYPEVQAGVTFDAASQCHLEFGAEAQACADPAELCKYLWCVVNTTCKTALRPAAPGTTCGQDMWCQNQKCVYREPVPQPRDGGWGEWNEWSECSRTCGAGVSTQSRECNNPEPLNNGKYCIGERSRYKVCNTDPCPLGEPSFREVQCVKYANTTYNNETIAEWVPYFDQDKPCDLQCVPRDRTDVEVPGGFVLDGTSCRQTDGARDMCIAGVCHKVGCDWAVDSVAEEDACGVCGGDGSACKTVHGIYNKGTTKQNGFSEVAVIPAGSKNVKIQEKVNPGNYISIGSAKTKKFYLNGARNQTLTEYFVAGSQAIYERDRDWEKVRIPGPIVEDIKVYQRIYRGRHRNPGVTYQYTVDRERVPPPPPPPRRYRLSDWSPCSVTCGVGHTRRHLECVDDRYQLVEEAQCYHIEPPRHEAMMAQCRQPACPPPPPPPPPTAAPAHWWVGAWSRCSRRCRMPGEEATKQRSVYCVDKLSNKVISEAACDVAARPTAVLRCADVPPC